MRNSLLINFGIALASVLLTLLATSPKDGNTRKCEPLEVKREILTQNNKPKEIPNIPNQRTPAVEQNSPDPFVEAQDFKNKIVKLLSEDPSRITPGLRTRYLEMLDSVERDPPLLAKISRSEFERAVNDPTYQPSIPGIFQIWIKNVSKPVEQVQITIKAIEHSANGSDQRVVRDIFLKEAPQLQQELEDEMDKNGVRLLGDDGS